MFSQYMFNQDEFEQITTDDNNTDNNNNNLQIMKYSLTNIYDEHIKKLRDEHIKKIQNLYNTITEDPKKLTASIAKILGTKHTVNAVHTNYVKYESQYGYYSYTHDLNNILTDDIMEQLEIFEMCKEDVIGKILKFNNYQKYLFDKIKKHALSLEEIEELIKHESIVTSFKEEIIKLTVLYAVELCEFNDVSYVYSSINQHCILYQPSHVEKILKNDTTNQYNTPKSKNERHQIFNKIISFILILLNCENDYCSIYAELSLFIKYYPNCYYYLMNYPLKNNVMISLTEHLPLPDKIVQHYKKNILRNMQLDHLSCECSITQEIRPDKRYNAYMFAGSDNEPFNIKSCKKKVYDSNCHYQPIFENNKIIDIKYYETGNKKCNNLTFLKLFKFKSIEYQKYLLGKYLVKYPTFDNTLSFQNNVNSKFIVVNGCGHIGGTTMVEISRIYDKSDPNFYSYCKVDINKINHIGYNNIVVNDYEIYDTSIFKIDYALVKKAYDPYHIDTIISDYSKNMNDMTKLMENNISSTLNIGFSINNTLTHKSIICKHIKKIIDASINNKDNDSYNSYYVILTYNYVLYNYKFSNNYRGFNITTLHKLLSFVEENVIDYIKIYFYVYYNMTLAKDNYAGDMSDKKQEIDDYYYKSCQDMLVGKFLKENTESYCDDILTSHQMHKKHVIGLSSLYNRCHLIRIVIYLYEKYINGDYNDAIKILFQNYRAQNKQLEIYDLHLTLKMVYNKVVEYTKSCDTSDILFMSKYKNLMENICIKLDNNVIL